MRRLLLLASLLALLPLAGCATASGQPLHGACLAVTTLVASNTCDVTLQCPEGKEIWITNFSAFVERGAKPVIECKPRRGSDLP